jgi:hypothetical protein
MSRSHARRVVLRDLVIFYVKTFLDGLKGVALIWAATGAAIIDVIFPGRQPGRFFYLVMRSGERLDSWLNLYGAAEGASAESDGLFGRSRAGSHTLLGRLEQIVRGGDQPRQERDRPPHAA